MRSLYQKEIKIVLIILAFKLMIISLFPLMGDEAYFIKWGHHLSLGYYDHPPMVGWVIYAMSLISDNFIFFRLFSFFGVLIVAYVIYKILNLYTDKEKSTLVALLFLVSPVDILLSVLTNDVPLLVFGSLGTLFLLYSLEKEQWLRYSLLSGLFLGMAFLSKYFALFLMLSLVVYTLSIYKTRAIKNVVVITLIISIFIFENLYFNYNSCWNNILFNFLARTQNSSYSMHGVYGYFLTMLYLITPWGLYFLVKKTSLVGVDKKVLKLSFSILSLMLVIFFTVSLKKNVGLHWFLLFLPYLYLLFSFIDKESLKKFFKFNAIFTAIHIFILLAVIFVPKTYFKGHKKYASLVVYTQPKDICTKLEKYKNNQMFITGYGMSSFLSYHCKRDIKMLFNKSKYGRFDDKLLDVRELEHKKIILFDTKSLKMPSLKKVCRDIKREEIKVDGAKFYILECGNFSYKEYKKEYLDVIKEKYYTIPDWLPTNKCYFLDRYYR